MNILYVHTHDTGRYIEPYNPGIPTSNLLRLAMEGTLFRQAYCCGPTCSPSRAALLTGQFPHMNGMYGLAHRGFSLHDYSMHLSNYLKEFGFETVLFGMQHEHAQPEKIGYDKVFADPRREAEDLTAWDLSNGDAAMDYLRKVHEKPFFMSYGLAHTHRPFLEIDEYINPDYLKVPECLPDNPLTRKDFAGYVTSAMRADFCIGRILDELQAQGLEEETIVLYTTDHGIAFPHMKCTLYDTGIGVSMIIKYSGNKSKGKACDALVSQVDVYPTLCDLAGIPRPSWLAGRSLVPVLEGEAAEVNEAVFSEVTYHASVEPQRCVRTKRYKYIRRYAGNRYAPANIDSGYSKDYLLDQGLLAYEVEHEMLFDLDFDPGERKNLINDFNYQDVQNEMRELLERHMRETGDFMESGRIPRPEGIVLNKVTCVDPDSENPSDYESEGEHYE